MDSPYLAPLTAIIALPTLLYALYRHLSTLLQHFDSMRAVLHRLLFSPRYKPTTFHELPHLPAETLFPLPKKPLRTLHGKGDIDARYVFAHPLSYGCEGETNIYTDTSLPGRAPANQVVIKAFHENTRLNPLPPHLVPYFKMTEWPSEIPATLYFANSTSPGDFNRGEDRRRTGGGFMYATDYFVVETEKGRRWRLVTPYLEKGTLETLAGVVRRRGCRPGQMDRVYRGRFRRILEGLKEMHDAGYCHNDVKMDNIFVSHTNSFLLGDLGNVREHSHVFHASPDPSAFRRADAERAVRSYMAFLRACSGSRDWFDEALYARSDPWARFYWRYKERSPQMTVGELLREEEFWAEDARDVASEWERREFERMADEMREAVKGMEEEKVKEPWWGLKGVAGIVGSVGGGGEGERRKSAVDAELCCQGGVGMVEKLMMPGARRQSVPA